jgi:anti-sigma factor RsiW
VTCDELMAALVDYLGQELVVEHRETFELHIVGCPKCESYVATYTHTVKLSRVLPKCGSLSPEFEARLRKALEPELGGTKSG